MEKISADVVIIGSGPSGQKAAIQASKLGKKVIVIEKLPEPGGNCLYYGTIPSKSLREAIIDFTRFNERNFSKYEYKLGDVTLASLNTRLKMVLDEEKQLVYRQFKKNDIRLIEATAHFEDSQNLTLTGPDGEISHQITSGSFIIATGSNPRNPTNVPFDYEVILDSNRLLTLTRMPKTLIVLGGGIIGSEYASFFAALGTEVMIIDKKDHLLPMLDAEIGIHLQTALTDIGLQFLGKKEPEQISRIGDRAFVKFKDGTTLEADALLYALGRTANIDSLHLENTGIKVDSKGYIPVNSMFQTIVPSIYAVGDVIGGPCLASTSMEQGRLAARHACGEPSNPFPTFFPIGIYTIPEISSCGRTEEELIELGYTYEVGRAYYYEIARSHIVGSKIGMFKILFHAETLEIFGVHIIGRSATEVIHIGMMAMNFGAKINYFIDQVFNYPTFAEGYRIAALNGFNKITTKGAV